MSTDVRLSKAQISKIIQSGGSFGSWSVNLGKKALINVAIPLARDNLSGLVSNLTPNAINKFKRKNSGKGAVRAGKVFTLFILKGALSGLRQFLATESPLEMMKNAFYFTSKVLFVLKIFNFLS